jgi:hypothetical protein
MKTFTLLLGWGNLRSCLTALLLLALPLLASAQSANVVISQLYAAGGNSGATYNQDFVELFNRSTSPVTVTGWTIQYATASGTFGIAYTLNAATIPAGSYYLVGIGAVGANGATLASNQATTAGGLATTGGKVALAANATAVTYAGTNSFSTNAVDVVGYGSATAYEGSAAAPAPAAAAILRAGGGCTDTNDNRADFTSGAVSNPVRNASTASNNCTSPVLVANPAALSFSAATGQVATGATYTLAGYNLAANALITISSSSASVLVSATGAAGSFARSITVAATGSGALSQPISVQFTAPGTAGTTAATISNSGSGLAATVAVTGTAVMAYVWNGSSTSFSNASSWTPTRPTPPGTADVLLFDGSVTPTPTVALDYAASQTVGQLQFINNVAVTLNTDDNRTLTVDGNVPGDDLIIQSGSTVTVAQSNNTAPVSTLTGLSLALTSLETAYIGGTLIFTGYPGVANGRHTLQATGTEAIQFVSGSRFQATSTYAGAAPFGTANAGSVVFRNGARFEQAGGMSPFGNTTPAVTAFEPASYFLFGATNSIPSLAGRTYGTLAYDLGTGGSSTATLNSAAIIQGDLLALTGTATINGSGTLTVLGNVQVANAATLNFGANATALTVQLGGTTAQTLSNTSIAAVPIAFGPAAALQINNAAGVTLGSPLTVPGTLQLTNGQLTTTIARSLTLPATATVSYTAGSNASFVSGPVVRPLSAPGTYVFPVGKGTAFRPFTLTITASNNTTYYYRAEQFEGNPGQSFATGSGLTRVSRIRSFTVIPFASASEAASTTAAATQPISFSGTVTLSFGSDDGVTDPAQLVVAKRTTASDPWASFGSTASAGTGASGTVTSGPIASFSDFALGSTSSGTPPNPLPVVLTSFGATRQASGAVQVAWATASEKHSAHFEVQRSLDGSTFTTITKVSAQGTTIQAHTYAILDQAALAAKLYYRLHQVDTDDKDYFSPVVPLAATEAAVTLALYPNPAHSYLTVAAAAGEQVQIIDLTGRVLQTTILPASGQLSVESLPAGTYLLRVQLGSQPRILRFTKE